MSERSRVSFSVVLGSVWDGQKPKEEKCCFSDFRRNVYISSESNLNHIAVNFCQRSVAAIVGEKAKQLRCQVTSESIGVNDEY